MSFDGVALADIKRRLTAYKGWQTRYVKTIQAALTSLQQQVPSVIQVTHMQTALRKLDAVSQSLMTGYAVWAMDPDTKPEETEQLNKSTDKVNNTYNELHGLVATACGRIPPQQPVAAAPAQVLAQAAAAPRDMSPKAVRGLQPSALSHEAEPSEFQNWCRKFRSYFEASRFEKYAVVNQQAFLRQCIDDKVESRLNELIHLSLIHI